MPRRILARVLSVVAAMTVALIAAPLAGTAQAYSATSGTLLDQEEPGALPVGDSGTGKPHMLFRPTCAR